MSGRELISQMRSGDKLPAAGRNGGIVDTMLALVAIIAVGGAGYFGITMWLGGTPPAPALPPVATVQVAQAETWTEADSKRCKAAATAASESGGTMDAGFANPAVAPGFAGLATAIECRLSHKVTRFCQPAEKVALVAMINDYLARIDLLTVGLGAQGAPMAVAGAIFGGEAAFGSDVYEMQRDDTFKVMALYHKRVAASLRALARDGIIGPDDFAQFFGMGIPASITEMLAGAEPERQRCA